MYALRTWFLLLFLTFTYSYTFYTFSSFVQVNHFPGTFQIGRKDRLWKNLSKLQARHGKKVTATQQYNTIYMYLMLLLCLSPNAVYRQNRKRKLKCTIQGPNSRFADRKLRSNFENHGEMRSCFSKNCEARLSYHSRIARVQANA